MKSLNGMLLLFLCVAGAHAEVYRVDDDSTSPNPNGASWASAFSSIRDAVQAAHQAGGGEVWVAEGTYTGSAGNPIDSGGAAAGDTSLILLEGVHVYGGFSGVESLREARDWQDHPTIIDGQNVRRCVFSSGIPYGGATLDGFTVRRGHTVEFGGGLYNDQSAPLVANCRFENNHAALHGGGVFNYKSPALLFAGRSLYDTEIAEQAGLDLVPAFSGVVFQNNSAVYGGGGVYSDANFLVLERCVFDGNTAGVGGGMYDKGGKTEFFRTTFQNNTATDAGAGYCYEGTSTTEFTNCLLNDNNSGTTGGGIYHDGYRVSLTHTTVAKNSAPQGGGVFGGQAFSLALNTIAYDNGATNIDDASDSPFTMLASCLEFEPADPAQGVINVDPLFLKPQLGFFGLASNSPALDAGISGWINVLDDLNGAPRPQGPEVDMGALEDHTPPVVTDSDNDGLLDAWEIEHFGNLNQNGQEDFDNDGLTNAEEFENQTDPTDADSDNDGHNDGAEVNDGRDPNDPGDYPGLVVFADPNLEAAVRSAINLPLGPIWVSDVVGVGFTSLTATNSAIQDLSGLEYCTDLTSVNFNRNLITDLTPLASLPNLTTAYISSNEVYDLGPLAMNTSIKRLLMENNHLSDVSPLAFMSQLTELTLNNNAISNIGPLAALPNLQSLSLIRNGITSFAALSGMTSLKELRIRENAITSIVPVNGLPNIELFDVSYNSVSVIPSGLQLPKLTSLAVGGNPLVDYAAISEHTGLKELYIWRTELTDLSPLANLSELTKLHAQDNNITDLTPLARLTKLYSLDIANNAIVDVTPIREFVQMELLWISSNEIEDISALDRLTALQMLSARNNHIGDISVLSHMPNLDSLDLEYNEISDISYLTDLVQLRTLDLDINRVRDLAPLANLPLLRTVELHSNPIRDIQALVNNPGIGAGDTVALQWTPLSQVSLCSHVPALTGRGVSVTFTGTCGADADGDDLADAYEAISNTSPTNPDTDGDGLNDGDERSLGTNPKDSDSDNDGMLDGTEVGAGTDPLDNTSVLSDVYVDGASGSDDTGVGTQSAPWATVAHAVDAVTGTMENTVSIHIARGVYTHLNATGGALWLDSHEHLLGGYEAAGWTRDADANETVLDASIAINGSPAPNVIVLDGVSDVLLDGLTVTGAYAPEQGAEGSAGILGIDLDATTFINNCRVVRNRGSILGSGGIRLFGSSPVITNSTIANNFAYGSGGGILLTGAPSHLIMDRCAISGNRGFGGGIVVGEGATVAITNSLINGNNAGSWGGGGLAFGGEAGSVIANTTIAHNNADWNSGGGIEVHSGMPLFVNCIFAGNRDYAILDYTPTTGLVLRNCLFNGNPEGDYRRFESITRNGAAAINTLAGASGNVDGDPAFVISQGVWTQAHTYSAATGRTTLVDAQASFTPGALAGTYLALFPSSPDVQLVVHSNTATTIEVVGQVSNSIGVGSAYSVIDYHLEPGSAAIDMGIDTSAPEDGGVLTDFDGVARGFDGDGLGAATADGSDYDIGAYESNTPVDSITVLAPNGGETFTRGTPAEIRWSSVGNVGTSVKILIRRGTYVGTLFGGTPNDGVHTWNIPSNYAIASGYTLEVVSVANPAISDASDAGFSIAAPTGPAGTLTVTAPNGGESYLQGATVPIAWTSTGSPGANVDILARRGAASVVLVSATPNDGAFNWIVPTDQAPGTDYVIEVRSSTTPTITDSSNAPFSISAPPTLLLSAPNGGESYLQGATVPIAWTSTGAVGTIVQLLAHGAGQTFSIDAAATNDGAYDWVIPAGQPAGTDYTIEVRALSNPAINDASNAPFTIQAPLPADSVTVLSPNGGESLLRGAPFQIRWSTTGNVGTSVKVVIRRGAYASTLFGGTPNDGVQTWNIPATYPVASGYSIEISSVANPAIKDTSDGTFAIGDTAPAASITVTAPNGGESYLQGGTLPITWTSTGEVGASVEILAHGAGQTFNLAASTANDGAFDWSIPAGQPTGTNYTIQVRSLANPAITDSSNSTFGINAAPPMASITVTAPNGGESYLQGGTLPITWTSTGAVGTIVQIFAHGAGQSFTVDAGTTNDGAYDWAIPAGQLVGTNYTIEVRSLSTPAITDSSNSAFSINAAPSANSITVISPNGGETLTRGSTVELRWSSTGIIGSTVKIVIRRGTYVGTLFGGTPNDGVHNWNIPSTYPTGTGFTIEISSVANPAIGDASDGSFTIATP